MLRRFICLCLPGKRRGVLCRYLQHVCGYSRQHLDRLIARQRENQPLGPWTRSSRTGFTRKFNDADVARLAEPDGLRDTLSGPVTLALARCAPEKFGDVRYARLATISVSRLHSLRASAPCQWQRKTRPSPMAIAIRKAPAPLTIGKYSPSLSNMK